MFIDTHTHLYSEEFDEDRDESIKRAHAHGILSFILPGIDSDSIEPMERLHQQYPDVTFMMAGLHPSYVKPDTYKEELAIVAKQLEDNLASYVAVGEIGIDLHWDKTTLEIQKEAFRTQIQWAKKYDLPIVIHCRKGFDEIFEILDQEAGEDLRGVFHCFGGTLDQAERA